VAELAVSGPLGEGNLADKLRPDPVHAPLGRVGEEPGQSGFRPGDLLAGLVRHPDPEPCRELGSAWTRRFRPVSADRIWLEVALVPSAPAERFVDPAHISGFVRLLQSALAGRCPPSSRIQEFRGPAA
jgi:hypothetical protein